jgi:hypothetical protein
MNIIEHHGTRMKNRLDIDWRKSVLGLNNVDHYVGVGCETWSPTPKIKD